MSYYGYLVHSELYHHGIKGQRWGIRRYENPDGTLTEEGKKRYGKLRRLNTIIDIGATAGSFGAIATTLGAISMNPLIAAPGLAVGIPGATMALVSKKKISDLEKEMNEELKGQYNKDFGISNKDYMIGKKYESRKYKGNYKLPKTEEDARSLIRYDRYRGGQFGSIDASAADGKAYLITHHRDKKGKIALSYARVPGIGDIYEKGPGNIKDVDIDREFKNGKTVRKKLGLN